jgi:ribose transport system substrate-binding protein
MRRRAWLALGAIAFAGCARGGKKRIAVIPKSTAHLFWISVEAGARAAAAESDAEILWNGPATESDVSRQIQIVDSMVAQRVDGIAIAAAERKAIVAAIDRAMAAGIPVTVFDSGVDSDNYTSFVSTDNYEAGKMGGRKLAELLGGKGRVAVIDHAPGSYSTMERERGFREVLKAEFPGMTLAGSQFGVGDRAKARAGAENILSAHPDLRGFFASTEPSSMGISLALKARGLAGKVRFVGFDSSQEMIDDLKSGVMDAMVVQNPYRLGLEAVRTLTRKLNGEEPPRRIDLPGIVVTKGDLSKPEIDRLLNPILKKPGV